MDWFLILMEGVFLQSQELGGEVKLEFGLGQRSLCLIIF